MRRFFSIVTVSVLAGALLTAVPAPAGASRLVGSFDTGLGGLVAVAVGGSDNVYVYAAFDDTIDQFTRTGTPGPTFPRPGASSNDFDLDVAANTFSLGSGSVLAGHLLVTNGDVAPQQLFGIDITQQGAVTGQLDLPTGSYVGGAYSATTNTVFLVDYSSDTIREFNPAGSGTLINEFPVAPQGTPPFDVFYGDVTVHPSTGNLFIVSSTQEYVREMTPTGGFVRDYEVGSLGDWDFSMSGISFDPASGNAFIVTNATGMVHQVALEPGPNDRVGFECDPTASECGTTGDDDLSADNGMIDAGPGDDTIEGIINENTESLTVDAGTGNDVITLQVESASLPITVRVLGGGGADVINVPRSPGALSPSLAAGDGNDIIRVVTTTASPRATTLLQGDTAGRYVIDSGAGNDRVTSGISADRITSAGGNDIVDGGAGDDNVNGGAGSDNIKGGAGRDALAGGAGGDELRGGDGANNFSGGAGSDICVSDDRRDKFNSCERIRRNYRRNHRPI